MKIEVKNLLNQSEGTSETHPLALANLDLKDTGMANVSGNITLTKLDDFILTQITGQATLTQPCSRCLEEVPLTIPLSFSREFKTEILKQVQDDPPTQGLRRASQEDENAYPIVDGEIDLTAPVTEEIIANIPVKVLCKDDCKGLCPKCGANLNDNPCQCDKVNYEIRNRINL